MNAVMPRYWRRPDCCTARRQVGGACPRRADAAGDKPPPYEDHLPLPPLPPFPLPPLFAPLSWSCLGPRPLPPSSTFTLIWDVPRSLMWTWS